MKKASWKQSHYGPQGRFSEPSKSDIKKWDRKCEEMVKSLSLVDLLRVTFGNTSSIFIFRKLRESGDWLVAKYRDYDTTNKIWNKSFKFKIKVSYRDSLYSEVEFYNNSLKVSPTQDKYYSYLDEPLPSNVSDSFTAEISETEVLCIRQSARYEWKYLFTPTVTLEDSAAGSVVIGGVNTTPVVYTFRIPTITQPVLLTRDSISYYSPEFQKYLYNRLGILENVLTEKPKVIVPFPVKSEIKRKKNLAKNGIRLVAQSR